MSGKNKSFPESTDKRDIQTITQTHHNLMARWEWIIEEIDKEKINLQKIANKYDPKRSFDEQPKILKEVEKTNYRHIIIMQQVCILVEAFLLYYQTIRNHRYKVRDQLIKNGRINFNSEQERIKNLKIREIQKDFFFPSVKDYTELDAVDRKYLRKELSKASHELRRQMKEVVRFRESYLQAYNKSKHSLLEITGIAGRNAESLRTDVYMIGKMPWYNSKRNGKKIKKVRTLVVGNGKDVLEYFEEIANHTARTHLLFCYMVTSFTCITARNVLFLY